MLQKQHMVKLSAKCDTTQHNTPTPIAWCVFSVHATQQRAGIQAMDRASDT